MKPPRRSWTARLRSSRGKLLLVSVWLLFSVATCGERTRDYVEEEPIPPVLVPDSVIHGPGCVLLRTPDHEKGWGFEVSVAFSPDGQRLAATWRKGSRVVVILCDPESGRELKRIRDESDPNDLYGEFSPVAFSPDGQTLAVGRSGGIGFFDAKMGQEKGSLKVDDPFSFTSLAYSSDGRSIAASTSWSTVILRNLASGKEVISFRAQPRRDFDVRKVAFSLDGKTLASAGAGPMRCRPIGIPIPGCNGWACGREGGRIRLWDLASNQPLPELKLRAPDTYDVAFSPDGKSLAWAGHGGATLWDPAQRKGRKLLSESVHCLAYSPDGRTLAFGTSRGYGPEEDGEVQLWDPKTLRVRAILRGDTGGVRALAFAPDGDALIAGGTKCVVRWDLKAIGL